ncbi:MAG: zinc ribbon domain-containing protein [Anaerolineae bacterium]|nr:zinc ribbon domain-containing protein [Anaerolineae bacterium]
MATQIAPFPPPNFIPTDSAVPGIEVYMPAPEKEEDQREVVEFKCPQCGAATAYSAADGGLTCTHCGYYEPPQKAVIGKGAQEFEFTVATMERAVHGWGEARRELQCQDCSAYTSVPADTLTYTCPFCNSNKVIQRQASQDMLRPRFLIPFKIEPNTCQNLTREWLGSSWMTPGSLKRLARVANFVGIYLPFWTFDSVTEADWKAEVGHTETERYYSNGEWRTRTKTVWKWESGHVRLTHDDLLVEGTSRVSALLLGRLKNYDLRQLAPYEPKYLAGLQAQSYDIPLEAAWETARHEMRERTRHACRDQASTSKIRNFSMNLDFADESWRYILLPVYLANYLYHDQTYQVMVNGQTGVVSGQRPVDWLKVWLAVIALLAPGLTLGVAGLIILMFGDMGLFVAVIGFILLVIGLIIAFNLIRKAQAMDDV